MSFKIGKDAEWRWDIVQNSDEWFDLRLGKVTASRASELMVKGKSKSGLGAGALTYVKEKVAEMFTGKAKDNPDTYAMRWGHDHEDQAIRFYEKLRGVDVDKVGIVIASDYVAVSPDGIVGDDGLVEVKCPFNTAVHIEYLLVDDPKKLPKDYYAQMQMQMLITNRQWCDFVSFDPRLERPQCLKVLRVDRDEEFISTLSEKIEAFADMVDDMYSTLKSYKAE